MLQVSTNSLVGKMYFYWIHMGGWMPHQENLCHFVRVVLLWAPLTWFAKQRLFFIFKPWMFASLATYLYFAYKYPGPVGIWSVALLTLIWVVTFYKALLKVLSMVWERFYYARRRLSWRIERNIERMIDWFFEKIPVERAYDWFFEKEHRYGIKPWMVAFAAFQISSIFWARGLFFVLVVIEAVILFLLAMALGSIYLEEKNTFAIAGAAIGGATRPVTQPVIGTFGVTMLWVMAMKKKVCPYIELV